MPKIPKELQEKTLDKGLTDLASNPTNVIPCVACQGTGKSSRGGRCTPCQGRGIPYKWVCPVCKREHFGFSLQVCRNEKCPSKKLKRVFK